MPKKHTGAVIYEEMNDELADLHKFFNIFGSVFLSKKCHKYEEICSFVGPKLCIRGIRLLKSIEKDLMSLCICILTGCPIARPVNVA